jgi:hypothetical protein
MRVEFSSQIFKKDWISNFIKIRPVEIELFNVDGQTDMEQIVAFPNFANAPNNLLSSML